MMHDSTIVEQNPTPPGQELFKKVFMNAMPREILTKVIFDLTWRKKRKVVAASSSCVGVDCRNDRLTIITRPSRLLVLLRAKLSISKQ